MTIAELLREARLAAGLTQARLADLAGTSQPTLAAYEAGRAEPRLGTLRRLMEAAGSELVLEVHPKLRRGATPLTDAAIEIATLLGRGRAADAWRRLLDFVDDFRGSPTAGKRLLVRDAPPTTESRSFDAALAGLAEFLCTEADISIPPWTDEPHRFAEPWWFVSGLRGLEATALRDSPIAFARHGVFLNEGAFDRV